MPGWRGATLLDAGDWVLAADASLYYLADLRRRLGAATEPGVPGTAYLVLAALRKWGDRFARYLEGDFSVIAFEQASNRVLLARDFGGRRNLAYSVTRRGVLVAASSPRAVVRAPGVGGDYDTTFVAASAVGISAHGWRTAFREVAVVPAGATLSFAAGKITEVDRWVPPPFASGWESVTDADAAEDLRELLVAATIERTDTDRPTAVWMSGGWDSTAVFASGSSGLAVGGRGRRSLLPISMTYPGDDSGNEDAHIRAVAERWGAPVRWVDADSIALLEDSERRARLRDDPMVQPFESTVRRLSKETRDLGARVALDGFGGDHLFLVSGGVVLAEHLFRGRWAELFRAWRGWPGSARAFLRICVLPNISPEVREWISAVRGRQLEGFWDRTRPEWINLAALDAELGPEAVRLPGEGAAAYESRKGITTPFLARALTWNHNIAMDEGVQLRSPLFDTRVIAFAAGRPLSDRGSGGDAKKILRAAMRGLLPESVLATRERKTGTPVGYFRRQLQPRLLAEMKPYLSGRRSMLAELGIVDPDAWQAAAERYSRTGEHAIGALLHLTIEAERWLAGRPIPG